jgi:Carboxylesterase family
MRTPTTKTIEKVRNVYPPIGKGGFNTFAKDAVFACQAHLTAKAWGRNAYRYSMSIPPATHGEDQFYYLFVNGLWSPVEYPRIARKLQKYFRNFILDGAPGGGCCFDDVEDGSNVSIPKAWLPYGRNETWMNITADGFVPVQGEGYQARRCDLLLEIMRDTRNGW